MITAKAAGGGVTPEAVADFAYLHMRQEGTGGRLVPAPHHWLWLRLMCDVSIKRLLIIAPPESAKTTWALAYMATHIAFFPDWPVILAAVTGPVATKRSIAIRNIIESEDFRLTFPEVQRAAGMAWRVEEWAVSKDGQPAPGRLHPTLFATGVLGAITGSRARLAVADDLLDNENTRTAHQRGLVDTWLHNSFRSRVLAEVGLIRMIGTAWHHDDSYSRIRRQGDWVVCHLPLLSQSKEVYATISYPDSFTGRRIGEHIATEAAIEQ